MKGYVIIDNVIIDAGAYEEFIEKIPAAIEANGGRVLMRTTNIEPFQGDWEPKRLVVIEFDSLAAARGFVNSAEYTALYDVRMRALKSRVVVAEGYDSGA